MILKRHNMSENKWNHFKIVPQGHNHCQLSIVNCQFGEAAKFQFFFLRLRPGKTVHNLFTDFLKIGLAFFELLRYDMLALRKIEC